MTARIIFAVFPHFAEVYLMDKKIRCPVEYCKSIENPGIKTVDLKPVFQANHKRISSLYLKDGHPNRKAYTLVAAEVFNKLQE